MNASLLCHLRETRITWGLVLAAVALCCLPAASPWLEYDRNMVAAGGIWRVLTCHLTHFNWDHLIWDALALGALGAVCERRSRWRYVACLLGCAVVIPAILFIAQPEMLRYRGLSGLDTGVFTLLAWGLLLEKWRDRDWLWLAIALLCLVGFAGKILFEFTTGASLFVDSEAANFTPAPIAHVVGLVVGGLVGIWNVKVSPLHTNLPKCSKLLAA